MNELAKHFKIKLNQNLWGLIVALVLLGVSEHLKLQYLFWFSFTLSFIMIASVLFTTFAYTKKYVRSKGKE